MGELEPLRLGIFGVGRMGRVHLENLLRLALKGTVELVALGDRRESTRAAATAAVSHGMGADRTHPPAQFDDPRKMAAAVPLDGVVVASRTEDHAADSQAFTSRGIPVLVEKPLANSVAEAVECVKALGPEGRHLVQVALQRFYDQPAQAAMEWVSKGLIGSLQQTHHVLQDKNPTPPDYQSSGITADMAIHLVFEAMSFRAFELPRYVQALRFMAPHYEDRAREGANIVHVFCTWADDSVAHLWGSRINSTGYENGFKLIGTDGRIDVGEFSGDFGEVSARLWRGTGRGPLPRGTLAAQRKFPMRRPEPWHPDFYPRYANAYAAELDAFLQHVRRGTPFELGPEVGWKTLLVANTAEQSSRLGGQRFELALEGRPLASAADAAKFAEGNGVS